MSARAFRGWSICTSGAAIGLALLLAPLATATAAGPAGAHGRVTAQDRSATHAYFAALYTYRSAEVANVTVSVAALQRFAGRLAAECPGVMGNAPREMTFPPFAEGPPPSPRQTGEHDRQSRQRDDLEEELTRAMAIALLEPDRQAALAFLASLKSLRWTNADLTAAVQAAGDNLESALAGPPLDACADMRVWVASGYSRLSPATRAFVQERNALQARIQAGLRHGSLVEALSRYEGPVEKALVQRLRLLDRQRQPLIEGYVAELGRLARTLGLSRQDEEGPEPEGPPKGAVVVGHGHTAAGTRYTIRVLPKPPHPPGPHESPCAVHISVETTESFRSPNGSRFVGGSAGEECLSRPRHEHPTARCDGGRIVVEGQTRNGARAVELRLSNGRQIVSRVTVVPRHLGGPLGFYYQAVKGPAPYPVSLAELDRRGHRLSTQRLDRVRECTAHPVHFLPHGIRTLVRAKVPGGPAFTIVGKHYRFQGRLHFKLSLELEGTEATGSSSVFFFGEASPRRRGHPLEWQMETGCSPHEYAILYGLLTKPHDTVWARVGGTLQPFHGVRIPASLHAGGVLVYAVLPELPSEVVVHAPDGKTVAVERLGDVGRELTEQCEGEAEPT